MTVFFLKSRNRWVGKFQFNLKEYRCDKFQTKSAAKAWCAEHRENLRRGLDQPLKTTRAESFSFLAGKYLDNCELRGMSANTIRAKLRCYRLFAWFVDGDIPVDRINERLVSDFLAHVVKNPFVSKRSKVAADGRKTANRYLQDLKAMFQWACANDRVIKNPLRRIASFSESRSIKYIPPIEDINTVILAADDEMTDRLICVLHLGARIGEVRRMQWRDVNFEAGTIELWTRKRRGGEEQSDQMAMTAELRSTLQRRWRVRNQHSAFVFCTADGSQFTRDMWGHDMIELCRTAGVRSFGYHAIRHYVASLLRDSGKATVGQIQKFLRHQRLTTTETYLHELHPERREMAGLLDNILPPVSPPGLNVKTGDEQLKAVENGGKKC